MENTLKVLETETEKWLARLEKEIKNMKFTGGCSKWAEDNIRAYIHDCKHFQKKGDFVRSFEAVVYAYGIYETAINSGLAEK